MFITCGYSVDNSVDKNKTPIDLINSITFIKFKL